MSGKEENRIFVGGLGWDVTERQLEHAFDRYGKILECQVNGLAALMDGEHVGPFNLGNPGEFTMLELAQVVKETIDSSATIEYKQNTADDPHMRKPDISKAKELLNWEPKVPLREGLPLMVSDFRNRILNEDEGKGMR